MSNPSNMKIRDQKFNAVLEFLATEVWTTMPILMLRLGVSETACRRTVTNLIKLGALKTEPLEVGSKNRHLIGITRFGMEVAEQPGGRHFNKGKTSPMLFRHHLETQRTRIKAEKMGATNWMPGRCLYDAGLPKGPDATFSKGGRTFAVENELTIKSLKLYPEIIGQHLRAIAEKHWAGVHYILPPEKVATLEKTFSNIQLIPMDGGKVPFSNAYRQCFRFSSLEDWRI